MVKNETSLKIKKLKIDNNNEYEDAKFKTFFHKHEIKMERIVLGTPQHNDITECINRTLTKRAKSMHMQSGLPK